MYVYVSLFLFQNARVAVIQGCITIGALLKGHTQVHAVGFPFLRVVNLPYMVDIRAFFFCCKIRTHTHIYIYMYIRTRCGGVWCLDIVRELSEKWCFSCAWSS